MKRLVWLLLVCVWFLPACAQDTRPELALQIGHVNRVSSLAVSPDGTMLASGGWDHSAKLWDAKTGVLRLSLPHSVNVQAVGFAGNTQLLTAGADGSIRVWDTASGALLATREAARLEASAAAFSRDGRIAAFGQTSGKIELRDTTTGQTSLALDGHPTKVLQLAFSPDGKTLISSSAAFREKPVDPEFSARAGDVRVWDLGDGELIKTLVGHALSVHGVAWSPDGSRFASAGESGTVVLWDAKTLAHLNELNISLGQGRAITVAFSPDGSQLVAGWHGGVQLWPANAQAAAPLWAVAGEEPVSAVAFTPDGRIAAGTAEGSLQLLDGKDGAITATQSHISPLAVARVSPDGNYVACCGQTGTINLWDAHSGALVRSWRGHRLAAHNVAFSPDGKLLATAGMDRAVRIWEIPSGKLQRSLTEFQGMVTAVAWSADGATLAVGGRHRNPTEDVTLWNASDGQLLATLNDTNGRIVSLAFGVNGMLAAAIARGDSWGQIVVWNAEHKIHVRQFFRGARSVAFSRDGHKLAAAGAFLDETDDYAPAGDVAQLWNVRAGEMVGEMTEKAPEARALGIAFSPDGQSLATCSRDGAIRLWDKSGAVTKTITGHDGPVSSIAFMPATHGMASAGQDGTVRLWDGATGKLRATLIALPDDENANKLPIGTVLSPEWLALTPEGYYDGSPAAGRFVQWRLGTDMFPVEAFESAYRKRRVVGAMVQGEAAPPQAAGPANDNFAAGGALPPRITIMSPQAGQVASGNVTVSVIATDAASLSSVQLLLNGRPALSLTVSEAGEPIPAGEKALEVGAKAIELGAKALELGAKDVRPIPAGHHLQWKLSLTAAMPPADASGVSLKVVATDGAGLQGWDEIRLARDPGAHALPSALHVLCVGVSSYANSAYNLKYAAADATAFGALWQPMQGKLFSKVGVTTLTDAAATSQAIDAAMRNIALNCSPDDVVAIFLSGHGVQKSDDEFFFASHDINLDHLEDTSVPWITFQQTLAGSKARRVVLFLDACHSGSALVGSQAGNENMAQQLVKGGGVVVFASSLGSQHSYELDDLRHGAFTEALIEGIGQGKADLDLGAGRSGVISVEELLTYLRARVPALTDGAQIPSCPLLRDFGEPFPLAVRQ